MKKPVEVTIMNYESILKDKLQLNINSDLIFASHASYWDGAGFELSNFLF